MSEEMDEELARYYLKAVDEQSTEVTDWEANFIESCMNREIPLTEKQKEIILKMAMEYDVFVRSKQ